MRVLQVVPSFFPAARYGGPIVSVLRLCQSVQAAGVEVDVATTDCDGRESLRVPTDRWVEVEGLRVRYFHRSPAVDYAFSASLTAFLARQTRGYDLIHETSTFSYPALAASWVAMASRVPCVVSPRGSLQAWSLGQKRWKKVPYWALLEGPRLRRAAAIHATAELERADVLRVLPEAKVFVVPNGVDLPSAPAVQREANRIVFLGRIHKKKGFDILVPALSRIARVRPQTETVIAGPDNDGEWRNVQAMIESATPRPKVTYVGSLGDDAKFRLLASARVFVLPSHSENFGQAVVEALACGTPVVVSKNCPWEAVESEGAGYWVKNEIEETAGALLRILEDEALAEKMGLAASRLAERFSWSKTGQAMADNYTGIVGGWRL